MAKLELAGGAYSSRSVIANAQRCVNYYPELNREDSPTKWTHYQRPGLRFLRKAADQKAWRVIYRASDGQGFGVCGQSVYYIAPNGWQLTKLGELVDQTNYPCKMIDNGTTVLLVDGSPHGYTITLADHAFAVFVDDTGTFTGANTVDYLDTFLLWNVPDTVNFGSTLSNVLTCDPLYLAGKVSYPDKLKALIINRQEIVLLGELKSEIWYNAGGASFPFARTPGAYIEHGCIAPYSVAAEDINVYWLGQDLQGDGVVFRLRGYDTVAISNHALVSAIRKMRAAGQNVADAIGYCYQLDQHVFYVLTFPSADQTWVYDASIGDKNYAWHQQAYTDGELKLRRSRVNCVANLYGMIIGGDFENGSLYQLTLDTFTDEIDNGVHRPISCIRSFPHILAGADAQGQFADADGKQIEFTSFKANLQVGDAALEEDGTAAQITLAYSSDRGVTFTRAPLQTVGAPGQYQTQPQWRQFGLARDCVFELEHSINGPAALNGAWVEARITGN